jgi:polyhydroxyalkanoate synthesis regulator phasin
MEKTHASDTKPAVAADGATQTVSPKRSPGHRGADVRDTVAEMAAKAQEISQEAGSKMAAAMKDVISAAAGLSGFAIESARDLVQYMVRRGQMTQEEADKLIREADDANAKRKPHPVPPPSRVPKPTPPPSPYIAPIAAAPVAPAAPPVPEPRRAAAPAKRAHAKPKASAKAKGAPKKKRPAARAKPKPSAKAKKSAKRR